MQERKLNRSGERSQHSIKNDNKILLEYERAFIEVKNITNYLQTNSILRVPLYNENCEEKSLRERDFWDADFLDQEDVYNICVLAKAAYYLDVKPLIDLSCRELASRMRNLSVKQLIDLFHIKQKKD